MFRHTFYDQTITTLTSLVHRVAPTGVVSSPPGLLVALSGGPDSVALLLAAKAWSVECGAGVQAAHFNHQLRGDDARLDEEFCRDLCLRLDVHLHLHRQDPRPLARQRGMGVEEAGRVLRYRFLDDLLDSAAGLVCAATAHHRDDQTETVVMRLFRGTGLDGLRGIRPVIGRIIRPLLEVSRGDIVAFLEAEGQPYRVDATNIAGDATRSRVRRELLPLARDICGSGSLNAPARLAELAETDLALLDRLAQQALVNLIEAAEDQNNRNGLHLPVAPLLELEPAVARRVIRLAYTESRGSALDLGRDHVDDLLRWLPHSRSGSTLDLPGGWRAVREFAFLVFQPPMDTDPPLSTTGSYRMLVVSSHGEEPPGTDETPAPWQTTAPVDTTDTGKRPSWRLVCPAAVLQGRLRLRSWRTGDRIELLGLGGHKKISDLLQEKRVGVRDRPGVIVVEDDAGILWVVGLARAERTRMLPSTDHKVTIAVESVADERN